ncbi:regulator of (H+)-ATPase in vacuolar membrane [Coemansia sp. 'formosensis']|nr:regulator of (H+)-ATPase in vacuolar membrane [Coemansia sp. 'formosensis']
MWELNTETLALALADTVGHVFILCTPSQPAANGFEQRALEVHDLWDGHKEPIFHISVDPYSQRVATHSTEGELLIWDSFVADGKEISVSRKMALDGSQVRTIAWAPTESEFIAATNDKVYRMQYSTTALQWSPGDSYMPQLSAFDRIFTFPADPVDDLAESNSNRPYFISTFECGSGCIRTWRVPGPSDCIEYVGSSTLSQGGSFDKASRVMPVSHPFFSRDNIMATFDASSGGLSIWGIRTLPEFVWFCSKKHRLPCMNVDMIRYNSIDKAAIVSTEPDGSQKITIWIFSSASRASHYLPAGTIYPRNKTDRVREIRWHLTSYAQTYLGVQWDSRVDVYCQERSLDDTWLCVMTIPAADFGNDKQIGSFSFTDAGGPTFSIDRQLVVHTHELPTGRLLCDIAYEEHGELPLIHPFVLTELMSWGQMDAVKNLLAQLYDYMRELEIDAKRDVALPMVPLHDLISPNGPGQDKASLGSLSNGPSSTSKYSALFSSELDDCTLDSGTVSLDFEGFSREKAEYLMERLTEIKVQGISSIDQARLMSIVGTISATQAKDQPIDSMGVRYFNKLQLLELENRRTRSSQELSYRELNWALHSNSQAVLLQLCLQTHAPDGLTWESARRMGLFMWLSDASVLHAEVEKMARNIFVSQGRDPTKCAIFYLALRKQRLLHGLWRTASTHPEYGKMVAFLANDFSDPRWKTAAAKNAYVLLSRQRYLDAATFFMLSGKLADAATICVTQLNDIQLAVTLCRCYEGDNGPVLKDLLWKHILPDAFKRQSRWLASLVFGIIHRYDLVLQSLTDDLPNLAAEIGVETETSSYSRMDPLDTELLILYRSMLTHSPKYRAPLVTQAELIAQTITIFECLGTPIMSLVVLEWWRHELYTITKTNVSVSMVPSVRLASSQPGSGVDPMDSGALDMSLFGAFAGFGNMGAKPMRSKDVTRSVVAVDPMDSGMLSMDSFGSMYSGMSKSTAVPSAGAQGIPAAVVSETQEQQPTLLETDKDAALLVDIEDTPVQYACRAMLALQIMEFICRAKSASKVSNIDIDKEKQTIADTLRNLAVATATKTPSLRYVSRLPTRRYASTPSANKPPVSTGANVPPAVKEGVRDPNTSFTASPKPAATKKKSHKIRNTVLLALLAGTGFVAAAAYAQEDQDFGHSFEQYVPGAKSFMDLIRYHDDSVAMAISDVGFQAYDDIVYTGRFIYTQFYNLLNMLQHNTWQGSDGSSSGSTKLATKKPKAVPAPEAPTGGQAAKEADPMAVVHMGNIQVAVDIPPMNSENKAVVALSKALSTVVSALNKKGLSSENVQELSALSDALVALDKSLLHVKEEERQAIEAALAVERSVFEASLGEFQEMAHAALLAREAQLLEDRDRQLGAAAAAMDERVANELSSQRDLLERRFNRYVRARVDEERGGRLAHLERVEAQVRQLSQMAQESGDLIRQSRAVSTLSVAISVLKSAVVGSRTQSPFASELSALASAATTDFPATRAAIAAIPHSTAELGVPSQVELEDRFEAVRKEIRSVSLVPENGNLGSQVLSATLSKVMFEKEGLVEGDDVEAVLSRAGFHLRQHNLDQAARELNQLSGWPKKLAEDWISAARRRLEVEQAIGVAESEELLAKFSII